MVLNEGTTQRLTVRAHYSDGTERDVTSLTVFSTTNDAAATIADTGVVGAVRHGEAFVLARFATFTVASQVLVVPKNLEYHFPSLPENNYIDTLVDAKLQKLRIVPSGVCDDQTFVRRAYLDLIGLLPTRAERDQFVADTKPAKRAKLVDALLDRPEFVDLWVMKWAELLEIRSGNNGNGISYKSALLYYDWLKDQFAHGVPIDKIVQALIAPSGGTFDNPATNYYQAENDTLKMSENTAQVFMGIRVQCAQCHNHPFDRWTMNDYYGFASFFTQVGRKKAEDPRDDHLQHRRRRSLKPRHAAASYAKIPRRRHSRCQGERPPRCARRLDCLAAGSVFRAARRQHDLATFHGHGDRRAGR